MRIIILLLSLFIVIGCGKKNNNNHILNSKTFQSKDIKMIEKNITIKLPPSSKKLNILYDNSTCIDPSFIAKIEIPISSEQSFINTANTIKSSVTSASSN